MTQIQEGKAKIIQKDKQVFYNPIQEYNRDLSILVIRQFLSSFPKKVKICEALGASGLRSIRYAKELPKEKIEKIVVNDYSKEAVESIRENILMNDLSLDLVQPNQDDACDLLYRHRKDPFDIIDLDPYGTAAPFIDAAVQAISEGGLLCITCTDMAVLCGTYPEVCYAKYGGVPLKHASCHEMALRLLLHAIQQSATRYRKTIEPLLCCSIDYYIRVFVRVKTSPALVKHAFSQTAMIQVCQGCKQFQIEPLGKIIQTEKGVKCQTQRSQLDSVCQLCQNCFHIGGPIWSDRLYQKEFVQQLLDFLKTEEEAKTAFNTFDRLLGMISVISEETDDFLYYCTDQLASVLHCQLPSQKSFFSALLNAGYHVSISHCHDRSVKTNAPVEFLYKILCAWIQKYPVNLEKHSEQTPMRRILKTAEQWDLTQISFEEHPESISMSKREGLKRFEQHKGMDWGPKARAKPLKRKLLEEQ